MEEDEIRNNNSLSKEQKIGFILLLAFGILAIGLGVLQIRNNMYSHFALNNSIPNTLKNQVDTVDALRFRDTDRDGLNDFDELYVYGTSQYIADTDSDGIEDGQEIQLAKNPLCPEGKQDCVLNPESLAAATISSTGYIVDDSLDMPAEQLVVDLATAIQDPVQVRQMLLTAGVSQEILDQVSDAELMSMISEMISSSSTLNNIQNLNSLNVDTTQ